MAEPEAVFRLVPRTRRAEGQAGDVVIVADRPEGRAGGTGMGLNGGQVLALAIGTCFSNDLQTVADAMGVAIVDFTLEIRMAFGGEPRIAQRIDMDVDVTLDAGHDPAELIAEARRITVIANTLKAGTEVAIEAV
jgi:organic hydroperoxide reductase OsmC/OhrA